MNHYLQDKEQYYKDFSDVVQKKFMQVRFGVKSCSVEQDIQLSLLRKEIVDWEQNNDWGALTEVGINYDTNYNVFFDHNTELPGYDFNLLHGGIGSVNGPGCCVIPSQSLKINYSPNQPNSNIVDVSTAGCITRINLNTTGSAGSGTFTFVQASESNIWTIHHGLGFVPNVFTKDNTGVNIEGVVTIINDNNLTISFSAPVAGTAYLS